MLPTLPPLTRTTPRRVPSANNRTKKSVDAFLDFFQRRIAIKLDECRQLSLTDSGELLRGQIDYYKAQVSTMKWLRQMNAARRNND